MATNPKALSLHIGLNAVDPGHYGGWSGPLTACESDADDMATIAQNQGFHTKVAKTRMATRDDVKAAITDASKKLRSGDIFFLSYSGHGGSVPNGGEEFLDGMDETWCLYDGQMIDDELAGFWTQFKTGVRILVLSDSCHSGTVVKAIRENRRPRTYIEKIEAVYSELGIPDQKFRFMPRETALKTYVENQTFYENIKQKLHTKPGGPDTDPTKPGPPDTDPTKPGPPDTDPTKEGSIGTNPIKATVLLISGCQDNQLSLDGLVNGLFTSKLKNVWSNGAFRDDYEKFHKTIVHTMPATQTPNFFVIGSRNEQFLKQKPFTV